MEFWGFFGQPSLHSAHSCSIREARSRRKLEGEMAGPRPDPQDSPSLRCYGNAAIFISLFMMLKALTLSVPERPGWLCPHPQCSTFSPRPGEERSDGGKGPPWGTPPPGNCLGWLALPFGAFWFPASALSFIFSGSNSPMSP